MDDANSYPNLKILKVRDPPSEKAKPLHPFLPEPPACLLYCTPKAVFFVTVGILALLSTTTSVRKTSCATLFRELHPPLVGLLSV